MIEQETIQKVQNYLNELNLQIQSKSRLPVKHVDIVAKKHKVSNDMIYYAVKKGFIERVERGIYKSKVSNFEPIHARQVIELRNSTFLPMAHKKSMKMVRNQLGLKLEKKQLPKGVHRYDVRGNKKIIIEKPKQKNISILWGLIKLNF